MVSEYVYSPHVDFFIDRVDRDTGYEMASFHIHHKYEIYYEIEGSRRYFIEDAAYIVPMCGQISRGTGHNCPSGLFQRAVAECLEETSDLSVYETNMELIYDELKALGFTVCKPDGTFYIFPKALEKDAKVFCQKAMKYDLALVPGDSFGCPGYFRMAYCIETEKVRRSFVAFEKFVSTEYGVTKQH